MANSTSYSLDYPVSMTTRSIAFAQTGTYGNERVLFIRSISDTGFTYAMIAYGGYEQTFGFYYIALGED